MQGITNVEVTCCDGHTELAVKGDNGPNESSIADVKYDLSKDDLNHILGCFGFCSVGRYRTGCERMGGEWDDSAGLASAKCKNIPNDNPTGSWEQVNTMILPIPGTSAVKTMEGGPCCNATDEIAKGVGKVGEAIGINIPGRSDTYNSKNEFDTFVNTWTNNVGSAVNTVAALGKCPVDVIRRVAGDNSAGAQCCSMTTETDADGIDRTYLNTPYFPSVEWNPTPSRCLQPKEECKRWAADTCSEWNAKTCTAYKDVCTKACGWATIPNVK